MTGDQPADRRARSWDNAMAAALALSVAFGRKHYVRGYRTSTGWKYGTYRVANPPVPGRSMVRRRRSA